MSYTKNETALLNFQNDISKLFYYVGEEDDQIPFSSLRTFEKYCIAFINAIEVEEDSQKSVH